MPLQIIRQDITKMAVDAIVNTTNREMVGYSGVDLAVHIGAGAQLDEACKKLVPLELGFAKITKGYNLDAKYIIHTSGPVWEGGERGEKAILKSCYLESLKLAKEYNCESVAFPLISSGVYGYPKDRVLRFAIDVIAEFLQDNEIDVYICVFDRKSYEFSKVLFDEISQLIDDDYVDEYAGDFGRTATVSSILLSEEIRESRCLNTCASTPPPCASKESSTRDKSFEEYMKSMDKPFAYKLFDLIDRRNMTDVECYKKANVSKKTFSKIKCNPNDYKPSKQTAVAFAIALELNLDETQELLASAGLTLSHSFTFDKIIRYFIQKEVYDIFTINEALFEFDQVLLGC